MVAVISNMTPQPHTSYRLALPVNGVWEEIINSDAVIYGGSGMGNMGQVTVQDGAALVTLPPLSTIMLKAPK